MGLCQGGAIPDASKQELESVYGVSPKPENFIKKHDGPGTVSMVSPRGPQFFILTGDSPRNDDRYVVVGRVVEGHGVVNAVASVGSFTGQTLATVVITDCGELREHLASKISACQKMSTKEFEQLISTSNKQLLNSLKKIMNVNKQLVTVDPEDVILEHEKELMEIAGSMEHNLNVLFHLKAEVCSLEKRQNQLLSQTRTKNSDPLTKKIPKKIKIKATFPAKLVNTSDQNPAGMNPHPFVTPGIEFQDFSDSGPLTKKIPKKKKMKAALPAKPVETTPQNHAGQAVRKCLHCEITKTPQWRFGPLGPKTLCNACGVRYKSGRLCPEYRPAASPTFVPTVHSNSHRKVVEMRNKGTFGDVATVPTAAEPEFILTESNTLWSI